MIDRAGRTTASILVVMSLLAACEQTAQSTMAADESGRITVADQPAGGSLLVQTVGMPTNGWVVVHAIRDGVPDMTGSIGHTYVPAGPSEDVLVPLDVTTRPGDRIAVVLHLDTGVARVFEFANGAIEAHDEPIMLDGAPVMASVTLS